MAIKYGFFDSVDGDRQYNSSDFNEIFKGLISERGVINEYGNQFDILSPGSTVTGNSYTISIKAGKAWLKGKWFINTNTINYTQRTPDLLMSRKDTIVIKLEAGNNSRRMSLTVIQGSPTPGTNPQPATLPDDSVNQIYYLRLGYITLIANGENSWTKTVESLVGTVICPVIQTLAYPTVTIDSQLSDSSTNPVQNKVITEAFQQAYEELSQIDSQMSDISNRPVKNRVIKQYVDSSIPTPIQIDDSLSNGSENPVQNKVITEALDNKVDQGQRFFYTGVAVGSGSSELDGQSVAVGGNASAGAANSIAIGNGATVNSASNSGIAIGRGAIIAQSCQGCVQIGEGTNSTPGTFQIRNTPYINLASGKIFNDRLNIDSAMSDSSTNLVANNTIKAYIDSHSSSDEYSPVILMDSTLESEQSDILVDSYNGQPFNCKHAYIQLDIPPASSSVQIMTNIARGAPATGYQGVSMSDAGCKTTTDSTKHTLYFCEFSCYKNIAVQSGYGGAIVATNAKWINTYNNIPRKDWFTLPSTINENGTTAIKINGLFPVGTIVKIFGEIKQ